MLSCLHELTEYSISLQMAPQSAACLLSTSIGRPENKQVEAEVLKALQCEWSVVLECEQTKNSARKLMEHCPYTLTQAYREILTGLESSDWKCQGAAKDVVQAWFPCVNGSRNIEDLFSNMADSVSRSSKRDCGSLANLQAVTIRALSSKCDGPQQAAGVHLEAADYEGATVRGIKRSCWSPASCPSSYWKEQVDVLIGFVFCIVKECLNHNLILGKLAQNDHSFITTM